MAEQSLRNSKDCPLDVDSILLYNVAGSIVPFACRSVSCAEQLTVTIPPLSRSRLVCVPSQFRDDSETSDTRFEIDLVPFAPRLPLFNPQCVAWAEKL
jgi:hypothetical protein